MELKQDLENGRLKLRDVGKSKEEAFADHNMADITSDSINSARGSVSNEDDNYFACEAELKAAYEQHMKALSDLEFAKVQLEKVNEELAVSLMERQNALEQAEQALVCAEMNARRIEELSNEITGTNDSLALVKISCIESKKGRAALHAVERGPDSSFQGLSTPDNDVAAVLELEMKLSVALKELGRLHQELVAAEASEEMVSKTANDAIVNIDRSKQKLEETQAAGHETRTPSSCIISESNDNIDKRGLGKALESAGCLQTSMEGILGELEIMRKELADLKEREANAGAAIETLKLELSKAKSHLKMILETESKANESVSGFSDRLKVLKSQVEEAQLNAVTSKCEAMKAREEAEHAKSAIINAQNKMHTAFKTAEAAKSEESVAFQRIQQLVLKRTGADSGYFEEVRQHGHQELGFLLGWHEEICMKYIRESRSPTYALDKDRLYQTMVQKKKKHILHSLGSIIGKKN